MIRIRLSHSERERVKLTFKTTSDARLRARCQAVLMAARGRARQQIAEDLGSHRSSVHRWLRAYEQGGLEGLVIQWGPGQPGRIPEALAPHIVAWVKGGPQSCGLNRANWTYAELADHLYKTHGIRVGETAMRTFCHRQGIRPYRPTYRYLRADPERQAAARETLAALKKSASGRVRSFEPGRGTLSAGPHAAHDARRQRPPAGGGELG